MDENTASVIAAFVTGILGFYGSKILDGGKNKIDITRDRLSKAYLPLFKAIEPYLYKKISLSEATKIAPVLKSVLHNSYALLDPYLSVNIKDFLVQFSFQNVDQQAFYLICQYVDSDYEKLKKVLGLPKRSIIFRRQHDQLTNSIKANYDWVLDRVVEACLIVLLGMLVLLFFEGLKTILKFIS